MAEEETELKDVVRELIVTVNELIKIINREGTVRGSGLNSVLGHLKRADDLFQKLKS
jgi:hypothetical protein